MKISKRLSDRGQGAVEYLQTYGWAILVVIIVGLVLWQLGVLSPGGKGINTAAGFSKIKVLEPSIKYYADTVNQSLNFTIVNGAGDLIRVDYIMIDGDCNDTVYPEEASGYAYLDQGGHMNIEGWNCSILHSGETFYIAINISYSTKLGSQRITHYDSGIIQGVAD